MLRLVNIYPAEYQETFDHFQLGRGGLAHIVPQLDGSSPLRKGALLHTATEWAIVGMRRTRK